MTSDSSASMQTRPTTGLAWNLPMMLSACLLCGLSLFFRLGDSLLWDVDECRNARCTVEMLERGDLVVPTFNGELRTHKPILLYWLTMSSVSLLGPTETAMRLPSALCGLGTVCCVWYIGRCLFSTAVAWLSALMLSSSLLFVMASRAATPDATLIFCQTLGLTFFVRAFLPYFRAGLTGSLDSAVNGSSSFWNWILMYVSLGLAMLAKGPVGLVLPLIICGAWLFFSRLFSVSQRFEKSASWLGLLRQVVVESLPAFVRSAWQLRPIRGVVLASAVAAPWYVLVGLRTDGLWLRGFFLEHNLSRAMQTMEGHTGSSVLFYPLALCVGFFPWSVFLGPALLQLVSELRSGSERGRALLFGLCWIGCPMLAFSLAATKLPSYITPGYPGIVLIVASYLDRVLSRTTVLSLRWQRAAFATAAAVSVLLVPGLLAGAHLFLARQYWIGLIPIPLAVASVLMLFNLQRRNLVVLCRWWAVGAALFTFGVFSFGVPLASQQRQFASLLQAGVSTEGPPVLAAWGAPRASWIYYADQEFPAFTPATAEDAAEFLLAEPGAGLLVAGSQLETLRRTLPIAIEVRKEVGDFPDSTDDTLCLVTASGSVSAAGHVRGRSLKVTPAGAIR